MQTCLPPFQVRDQSFDALDRAGIGYPRFKAPIASKLQIDLPALAAELRSPSMSLANALPWRTACSPILAGMA